MYDEVYGTRPWKGYEARFAKVYSRFLKDTLPQEAASEQKIKASPEYQDLDRQAQAAEKAVAAQVAEIDRKVNQELVPRSLALNEPFQEVRGHVGALTYQIEISKSESSKESMRKEIEELKKEVHTVKLPTADGSTEKLPMDFATMDRPLQDWKAEKAALLQKRVDLMKPATELRAKQDEVSDGPHLRRQRRYAERLEEQDGDLRRRHPPDPRQGRGPGGPLRILPHGHRASR